MLKEQVDFIIFITTIIFFITMPFISTKQMIQELP